MTYAEAYKLLCEASRHEVRDHVFGDREVYWKLGELEIADGYFGGGSAEVHITYEEDGTSFRGEDARQLVECGREVHISRNDTTGPDHYVGM